MKAISLWRPWDLFVLLGWKMIETRTHERFKSLVGTRIAIHSAKKIDPHWRETAGQYLPILFLDLAERSMLEGGHVHGLVEVLMHRKLAAGDSSRALTDCGDGDRFGLDHSQLLETPLEIRGRQGIFNVYLSDADLIPASVYSVLKGRGDNRRANDGA